MTARRGWGALRLALGVALLAFILVRTDAWRAVPRLAGTPWVFAVLVAQCAIGASIEAFRLTLLLRSQAIRLSWSDALRLVLTALPFVYVVPGGVGGDVVRAVGLGNAYPARRVELAAVVLTDRLTGLASLLLVALLAALLSPSFATAPAPLRGAALAATIALAALGTGLALAWSTAWRGSRLYGLLTTRAPFHGILARVSDALFAFRDHKGALLAALGVTGIIHVAMVVAFALAGRVLLPAAPAGIVGWTSLLAFVATAVPLTPGGLGVGEAAFAAAFRLQGYAGGAQLLVAWRLAALPFAAAGVALYILGQRWSGAPQMADARGTPD